MTRMIDAALLDALENRARVSPRARQHLNLHSDYSDPCQRFLNAILSHSYIRPHRHASDPKVETLFVLRGRIGVLTFDDAGAVKTTAILSPQDGTLGAELASGTWHTAIALSSCAIMLEMKAGPFSPDAAKDMASWAPADDSLEASSYLEYLRKHCEGR